VPRAFTESTSIHKYDDEPTGSTPMDTPWPKPVRNMCPSWLPAKSSSVMHRSPLAAEAEPFLSCATNRRRLTLSNVNDCITVP
jgi:hypothetical protein